MLVGLSIDGGFGGDEVAADGVAAGLEVHEAHCVPGGEVVAGGREGEGGGADRATAGRCGDDAAAQRAGEGVEVGEPGEHVTVIHG
jgi:hypothetical protein